MTHAHIIRINNLLTIRISACFATFSSRRQQLSQNVVKQVLEDMIYIGQYSGLKSYFLITKMDQGRSTSKTAIAHEKQDQAL